MSRRIRALVVILWASFILLVSSLPAPVLPPAPFALADKVYHVSVYTVLGVLSWPLLGWPGVVYSAGLAVIDELHQKFIPGRTADLLDLTANIVGIAAGTALACAVRRRRPGP